MSLNAAERAATAEEITQNLRLSGLTREELRTRTGLSSTRFDAAVEVSGAADPADVWLVRDAVDAAVRCAGRTPVPFSTLREDKRAAAEAWFGYRRPADL